MCRSKCTSSGRKDCSQCSNQGVHTCSNSRLKRKKLEKPLRSDHRPEISTSTTYWRALPDLLANDVGDMEEKDHVSDGVYSVYSSV